MTIHISRDYNPTTTGYFNGGTGYNRTYTSLLLNTTIFLHRVLGYSIVGEWGFNLDGYARALTISASGNGNSPTITTSVAHGLNNGDWVQITGATGDTNINGNWMVQVVNSTQAIIIGAASSAGTYNPNSATLFTGFFYAGGQPAGNTAASLNVTGAPSVYDVAIPPTVRGVTAADSGRILALKSASYPTKNSGTFKITSINQGNTTNIASGSNNMTLPQSIINVTSTAGFPTSGTIYIQTGTAGGPLQVITYTGTSGGTQFTGCSGGTGTLLTNQQVSNANYYLIDYRSTDTPPPDTTSTTGGLSWWLYENEAQASQYIGIQNNSNSYSLTAATNATPIVVTTSSAVPLLANGQVVSVTGILGNTAANGTWTLTALSNNTFQLNGSAGNGTYTSGGTINYTGYTGNAVTFSSKIILQSPHATGWQVRFCVEPQTSTNLPIISVAIGYQGTTIGDFPQGGVTSHIAQFLGANPSGGYVNAVPGGGASASVSRLTVVGDDGGQAFFLYGKISSGGTNNGILLVGIPDNEPVPNYPNTDRIFTYGSMNLADYGTIQLRAGTSFNGGMTFRNSLPEMMQLASWANLDGTSGTNPFYSGNAGDSPFTSSTEVIPIEVWGGTTTDPALNIVEPAGGPVVYYFDQRFMGTAPFLRYGRTNFTAFTQSTDSTTTLSVSTTTGSGVSPIQVTTTTTNALTTGQTVVISGVAGNTAANGTFVITVINNTTFTLNGTTGNGTYVSGGTINGTPHWLHLQNGIYLLWNGCAGLNP
jgi:hypothetical protein